MLKKLLNSGWFWGIITGLIACFLLAHWCETSAQNVTRQGKLFVQQSNSNKIEKDTATLTGYYYQTTDGTRYPIYMSSICTEKLKDVILSIKEPCNHFITKTGEKDDSR